MVMISIYYDYNGRQVSFTFIGEFVCPQRDNAPSKYFVQIN